MERRHTLAASLCCLVALVNLTNVVSCAAPGRSVVLTKATLTISYMLRYDQECADWAHSLVRAPGDTPNVLCRLWGLVWLEDEGVFAAGKYFDSPEVVKEAGTPIPPEWVEVRLTRAEALEYFRLLLDGHTALTIAKELGYPHARAAALSLCQDQVRWFPYLVENRRVVGREFLKVMADAMDGPRVKKPSGMLSEAGRLVVEELGDVPLEKWPEWYRKNGRTLQWDPLTEKYAVAGECR